MTIAGVDVWSTAKRTFAAFRKEDLQGLAAEVAYHFLFSVVPLLIFLTALSGFISDAVGTSDALKGITEWLFENLPASTATAVREPVVDVISNKSGSLLSFGGLLALWGGKNAMGALIKALNIAFNVKETRSWVKRQLVATGLTLALGLAIVAASSFFLAGSFIGEGVASWLGLGHVWTVTWAILRWPAILALLIGALAFLYWAGPNVDVSFRWLSAGSVVAVVLWGLATLGLSTYFRFFGGYAETYGALGGVLAFVFWLYLMSLILLLGGEVNSVLALGHDPATKTDLATDPAKRGSEQGERRNEAVATSPAEANGASGSAGVTPVIGAAVPWPSAERSARVSLAAEGSAGERRRFKRAVAALGFSSLTAISTAILSRARRK